MPPTRTFPSCIATSGSQIRTVIPTHTVLGPRTGNLACDNVGASATDGVDIESGTGQRSTFWYRNAVEHGQRPGTTAAYSHIGIAAIVVARICRRDKSISGCIVSLARRYRRRRGRRHSRCGRRSRPALLCPKVIGAVITRCSRSQVVSGCCRPVPRAIGQDASHRE